MTLARRLGILLVLIFSFFVLPIFVLSHLSPVDANAAAFAGKAHGKDVKGNKNVRLSRAGKAAKAESRGGKGHVPHAGKASKKTVAKTAGRLAGKSARQANRHEQAASVRSSSLPDPAVIWVPGPDNLQHGKASWYGRDFHGGPTASGVAYDMHTFTAAHRTLPLGTVVKVTDKENGKSVMVCVTDRGPFVPGRIIDLSYAAADKIDLADSRGVGPVALEVVSDGNGKPLAADSAYYVSYSHGARIQKAGPFYSFADAAAMHEAVRQVHPDAEMIVDRTR